MDRSTTGVSSSSISWRWFIGGVGLILAIVTSACTATVAGFTSPVAHDYGSVQWYPLTETVEQAFVSGPGYADAVANDARTTPAQLQERLLALPEEARTGDLTELRVGLRLESDGAEARGAWDTRARVQLVAAPDSDQRFPESRRGFHAWPETDVWLPIADEYVQSFLSPYSSLAGITVRTATFGGDLSAGDATVGPGGAELLSLPVDGEPVTTLASGARVRVVSASEGWAQVALPEGATGFASLERFASLPEPSKRPGDVLFTLRDGSGTIIREAVVPGEVIHDNAHLSVAFDPIPESSGQFYTFRLAPARTGDDAFTLRATEGNEYRDGERGADAATDLVFQPEYTEAPPLMDFPVDALPRDGDWIVITSPPAIPSGIAVALRLVPGDGENSGLLQFGITAERAPYGTLPATDVGGKPLPGALTLVTRWERDVPVRALVTDGAANLKDAVADDPLMATLYLTLLGTLAAVAVKLRHALVPRRG